MLGALQRCQDGPSQPAVPPDRSELVRSLKAAGVEKRRELQDDLLEDLGGLVSEMKAKSLKAREAVREDTATLDSTGSVMDDNQAKLDANNETLKQQVKSMRSSTCMTWLMLLMVVVLFIGTFLFMKLFKKKNKG